MNAWLNERNLEMPMNAVKPRRNGRARGVFLGALSLALLPSYDLVADSNSTPKAGYWHLNGIADGARVLREGSPFWEYAGSNDRIKAGSDVEIPEQGGLIRSEFGAVSAFDETRFWIPSDDNSQQLEQVQGGARYHINRSLQKPFQIETPDLALAASGSVFEIRVDAFGTQVDVVKGTADVATMDGLSDVRLDAGQSARVSSTNLDTLEIRRSADANFVVAGLRRSDSSDNENGDADPESLRLLADDGDAGEKNNNRRGKSSTVDNVDVADQGKDAGKGKGRDKGKDRDEGKDRDKGKGGGKGKDRDKGKGGGKGKK